MHYKCITRKWLTLTIKVKVMEYNIRNGPIWWQQFDFLSDGNNHVCSFSSFTCQNSHLKRLTLKIKNFRLRSWSTTFAMVHSTANINHYKNYTWVFSLALTVFEIFTFQNLWPWKYRSSWCTTFAVAPFDDKYLTSYLIAITIFAFFMFTFQNSHSKVWPWKVRLRSLSTCFLNNDNRWPMLNSTNNIFYIFDFC